MKKLYLFLIMIVTLVAATALCLADPSPSPSVSAIVAAGPTGVSAVLAWIDDHRGVIGMLIVGVLDLLFALNPNAESNGILHWIFTLAQGWSNQTPPPKTGTS